MKLTFDLPKEYNDMSRGEIAQLSMKIKKLVDDLNFVLSNLSEENMTKALREKLQQTSSDAKKALEIAKDAMDAIEEIKEGEANVSAVDEVFSEDT
jgi:ElaB/YqjD/DUF883 family membrane-anchored ribosome-binding protein